MPRSRWQQARFEGRSPEGFSTGGPGAQEDLVQKLVLHPPAPNPGHLLRTLAALLSSQVCFLGCKTGVRSHCLSGLCRFSPWLDKPSLAEGSARARLGARQGDSPPPGEIGRVLTPWHAQSGEKSDRCSDVHEIKGAHHRCPEEGPGGVAELVRG